MKMVVGNRDVADCVRGRILALAEQLNCETADAAQSEPEGTEAYL